MLPLMARYIFASEDLHNSSYAKDVSWGFALCTPVIRLLYLQLARCLHELSACVLGMHAFKNTAMARRLCQSLFICGLHHAWKRRTKNT
jgi:hypothetical protein